LQRQWQVIVLPAIQAIKTNFSSLRAAILFNISFCLLKPTQQSRILPERLEVTQMVQNSTSETEVSLLHSQKATIDPHFMSARQAKCTPHI
jgi:hypothetical protein